MHRKETEIMDIMELIKIRNITMPITTNEEKIESEYQMTETNR